jgi:hypothetical protein
MGDRDSELAMIIEDTKKVDSRMAGRFFEAKEFAYKLRVKCFKSIFGFLNEFEIKDPCDDEMWEKIVQRTKVSFIFC